MYIVKNVTRHPVSISDLRAEIAPGKVEDLDRLSTRYRIDQSKDLNIAMRRGALKVLKKDDPNAPSRLMEPSTNNITINEQDNVEVIKEMQKMEKRIVERVNAQVQKAEATPQQLDPQAVEALQAAIDSLKGMVGNGGGQVAQSMDKANTVETEIPNDVAVDIHQRTIDRLSKGSTGSIKQQETSGSSDVDKNIDELGDIL